MIMLTANFRRNRRWQPTTINTSLDGDVLVGDPIANEASDPTQSQKCANDNWRTNHAVAGLNKAPEEETLKRIAVEKKIEVELTKRMAAEKKAAEAVLKAN